MDINFAGWNDCSFIDYPEEVAFVAFTAGCNLECAYCHNYLTCVKCSKMYRPEEIVAAIKEESTFNMIDAIVITGGEPTLYSDLPFFIQSLTALKKKIKLDTNGTIPGVLSKALKNGVDFVAIDFKWPIEEYGYLSDNFLESLKMIRKSGIPYQIRTTIHKRLLPPEKLQKMVKYFKPGEVWVPQLVVESQFMRDPSLTAATNYTADELREVMASLKGPDILIEEDEDEDNCADCAVSDLL